MILEVCSGAVVVMAAGTIGRGPLDHLASSGRVSRLSGTRKTIIRAELCENLKVPLMGELCTQLRARKGKGGPKSHYQIVEIANFRFSQTCSEAIVGHCGHGWTCANAF